MYSFKRVLLVLAAAFAGIVSYAQVTTSSLGGRVVDENGEPVPGAAIVATHTPSGTVYGVITNLDGRYTIQGMRTGGPYTVEVSSLGYQSVNNTGVTLQLGELYNLDATLRTSTEQLDEVVVVASPTSKFAAVQKTGATTNINNSQMMSLPSAYRDIQDMAKISPYAGSGMSLAGGDGRMTNFTVDGANFNNNFGLSSNLPGGGNPISIEAIEEMQVVISPFDVRETNFIGGGVNAITKSGTNMFRGSAYVYHRNENLRGDAIDHVQITGARATDQQTTYGFSLGGPIIKNKLFFFVNGEMQKTPTVVNRWHGSATGEADADNYTSRTTLNDLARVSEFVREKYGYDTGSWTDFPADENNYKLMARLDWNISEAHNLALRYNYTKNHYWQSPNASSMDGGTRSAFSRMSQYSMSFANSMYGMSNKVHSFSIDLNSRLTDRLSNELLFTFSKLDDVRDSESDDFPFVDILDGSDNTANYMALGYELFTWNNAVHNTIWNVKDDITYYLGTHKITAGLNFEHQMADNQYMRNGTGYYRYKSLNDFLTGATPEVVCLTYGYDGEEKPAARVQFNKLGLYLQDDWNVTERLKVNFGTRIDGLFFNNKDLMTNKAIYDLQYGSRSIDTGKWPNSTITFSPRVGFTYDVFGDRSLKIRGGSGFFLGRLPLVFFTNMPTYGGMVQYQAQLGPSTKYANLPQAVRDQYADMTDVMAEFKGGLLRRTALQNKLQQMGFPQTVRPEDGTVPGSISAVDPKFKMPQVWKSSLAIDYQFPVSFPLTATVEGIFNKTINAASISDWSIMPVEGFARWNGADNRPVFPESFRTGTKAFVLENTSKGYGWSANVTLNAQPIPALSLMAAYTHTVSKEITGLPGSAAESAFTYVPTFAGPNNIKLHNSQYVTPDRIVASATAHDKSGNHYSLIYETWRGGYVESYMMANDMNGDGYNYDAIYVPNDGQASFYENGTLYGKGDRSFRFASRDDMERFMGYVHGESYLKKHQGDYAEPYSVYSPWVHRIDFSYKHDFKLNIANNTHRLQLSLDVKNVLNLFNSAWGVSKYMNPDLNEGRILKYERTDAEGYPVFSTPAAVTGNTKTWVPGHFIGQCWYASVGIKYMFN